jgi:hypothetical protein
MNRVQFKNLYYKNVWASFKTSNDAYVQDYIETFNLYDGDIDLSVKENFDFIMYCYKEEILSKEKTAEILNIVFIENDGPATAEPTNTK